MIRLFFNQRMQSDRLLVRWLMIQDDGNSWSHLLSLATLCGCCCVHCCLTHWCFDNVSILQLLYYSIITWMEATGNIHYSNRQKQPFHSLHRRNMFNKFKTWPIYYILLYVVNDVYIMYAIFFSPSTMIQKTPPVFLEPRIGGSARKKARSLVTNISPDSPRQLGKMRKSSSPFFRGICEFPGGYGVGFFCWICLFVCWSLIPDFFVCWSLFFFQYFLFVFCLLIPDFLFVDPWFFVCWSLFFGGEYVSFLEGAVLFFVFLEGFFFVDPWFGEDPDYWFIEFSP